MMKFIETLFLGMLIACTALIAQVFVTVIAELFFRITFVFQYLPTDTLSHIILLMLAAATIEELLRYLIIKKRTSLHVSNVSSVFIYGALLGIGFASFEALLALFDNTISISNLFMFAPVLIIHISLSIFLLFFIKSDNKISQDALYIVASIIIHTLSNLTLFYFFA